MPTLFIEEARNAVISKITGHRSDELARYKHLSLDFKNRTTELIAGKPLDEIEVSAAKTAASPENEKAAHRDGSKTTNNKIIIKK